MAADAAGVAERLAALLKDLQAHLGGEPLDITVRKRRGAGAGLDIPTPSSYDRPTAFHDAVAEWARSADVGSVGLFPWGVHLDLTPREGALTVWASAGEGT